MIELKKSEGNVLMLCNRVHGGLCCALCSSVSAVFKSVSDVRNISVVVVVYKRAK